MAHLDPVPTEMTPGQKSSPVRRQVVWMIVGLSAVGIFAITDPPSGLSQEAWRTVGILLCTVIWWVTEVLPIPVTGMLSFLFFDLTGVISLADAVESGFGSDMIIFLLGVMALSAAFQVSGLSTRVTRSMLRLSGTRPWAIIGVFFWTSFIISMCITDVAVVAMMLPPAVALLRSAHFTPKHSNFGRGLMMAIMFGATQGGACTPAGVSANVATHSILRETAGIQLSFLDWTLMVMPIFVVLGFVSWWLILRIFPPEVTEVALNLESTEQFANLEQKWGRGEIATAVIFVLAIVLWLGGPALFGGIDMKLVALLAFVLLFLPGLGVFAKWQIAERDIEWGAILLIVTGVMIGTVAADTGLASWFAENALAPFAFFPAFLQPFVINILVAIDSIPLANLGASASINVPFAISYAETFGFSSLSLGMAAGMSAAAHYVLVTQSPSFVLPYAYGFFSFKDFAKIGILVTLLGGLLISVGMWVSPLY